MTSLKTKLENDHKNSFDRLVMVLYHNFHNGCDIELNDKEVDDLDSFYLIGDNIKEVNCDNGSVELTYFNRTDKVVLYVDSDDWDLIIQCWFLFDYLDDLLCESNNWTW